MSAQSIALLERVVRQIEEHPETWEQDKWSSLGGNDLKLEPFDPPCGTSFCVAGWAVTFAGYRWRGKAYVQDGDDYETVATVAQRELELTHDERIDLFRATNSLATVQAVARRIIARQLEELYPTPVQPEFDWLVTKKAVVKASTAEEARETAIDMAPEAWITTVLRVDEEQQQPATPSDDLDW